MSAPGAPAGPRLWRAAGVLMAGGVLAQALPLLLGPWLARLYTPAQWGAFAFFAAVAANLAVVACARYDFALPLERDDDRARALLALCARVGVCGVALAAVAGFFAAALHLRTGRPDAALLWALLPLVVAAGAGLQALGLWASRAGAFGALAVSRVLQHGGGAGAQLAIGLALAGLAVAGVGVGAWAAWGAPGLALGALAGALAAFWPLRRAAPPGGWRALHAVPSHAWRAMARAHADFPRLNAPHAFLGALQDAAALALIVGLTGEAAAGWWALALRYLKAPATLVGGSVAQALYPQLAASPQAEGLRLLRRTVGLLSLQAIALAGLLFWAGPALFRLAFGPDWAPAGELARALALYVGAHFVASPLGVVTLAWRRQGWALGMALLGQALFLGALAVGLLTGGPMAAAWAVSVAMAGFYAAYALWLVSGRLTPGGQDGENPSLRAAAADVNRGRTEPLS